MRNANRTAGVLAGCVMLVGAHCARAQDWPQWRGPNRDNKVTEFTAPATWPKELVQKWKVSVGLGHAGPALVGDKVYVFTRQGDDEVTRCRDAASGKELWLDKYAATRVTGGASAHPGTRSTPAVAEGKVFTLGAGGVLSCLDAATGKVVWRKDKEFAKPHPMFFAAQSPIIVDGKCIVHLGTDKDGAILAYDLASGESKWKWDGEGPSYGSPVLATIDGTKQIVAPTERSLVGIGVADGKLLWQVPFLTGRYNTGTPVIDGQTVICVGQAFKVEKQGDGFTAKQIWKSPTAPHNYNTPVLKDGLLYGISNRRNFFCANAQTGEVLWTDMAQRGECGTILDAGSVLLAVTSDSYLVAFKPSPKGYEELAKIKVADTPTWAPPVISGNRVLVKDRDSLALWTFP